MRKTFITKLKQGKIELDKKTISQLKPGEELKVTIEPVRDIVWDKAIPYGHQNVEEDDINAVVGVLESDLITQGPKALEFEKKLCEYTKAKYAVVCSNGTAALHLAVKALHLKEGFEGITTPNTFVASSNCILYNNGRPVFADIERDTYNIAPEVIKKKVTEKTRVIIPVDFAGQPCDMEKIHKIAREHDCYIIRDACHSIGSTYKGGKTGNCQYSDMTVFSFHPVKNITTGEGGAVLTNDKKLYERLKLLRAHGITRDRELMEQDDGPWYYEMIDLGFNFRITDFQCALGISQLKKLDRFMQRRREIVNRYNKAFKDIRVIKPPFEKADVRSAYHLYVIQIEFDKINYSRAELMKELEKKQIGVMVHYIPVHLQPFYQKHYGTKKGDCPAAEEYYSKALSLPIYPRMTDNQVEYVIKNMIELLG
ncbi:MAG: UDP-4-amino-4,6-dideoxy-N-acetyl-beta-L-altrosamine transaminase [Spirochaetes bacterium]|nr:UDP-4-amino-4,6-dideoxy-N-acetyl-beta-L-altrosamine transaminase [Spirochaetota bacterium]